MAIYHTPIHTFSYSYVTWLSKQPAALLLLFRQQRAVMLGLFLNFLESLGYSLGHFEELFHAVFGTCVLEHL